MNPINAGAVHESSGALPILWWHGGNQKRTLNFHNVHRCCLHSNAPMVCLRLLSRLRRKRQRLPGWAGQGVHGGRLPNGAAHGAGSPRGAVRCFPLHVCLHYSLARTAPPRFSRGARVLLCFWPSVASAAACILLIPIALADDQTHLTGRSLIIGAYAGRMRLFASLLFCSAWMLVVYCPFARMVWGGGFLEGLGLIDFAGGVVIHVTAGASALVAAHVIGPRARFAAAGGPPPPSNVACVMAGTGLIWTAWLAFNGGSTPTGVSPQVYSRWWLLPPLRPPAYRLTTFPVAL